MENSSFDRKKKKKKTIMEEVASNAGENLWEQNFWSHESVPMHRVFKRKLVKLVPGYIMAMIYLL